MKITPATTADCATIRALGFYERLGMRIADSGDFDIGDGYYMNDYIMSLALE